MCGIVGYISPKSLNVEAVIRAMSDSLVHRGPDASGYWSDLSVGLALGHRRLSIIDLSSSGAQPMMSASGRYVIVLNGEIYNFEALRKELGRNGGKPWRGTSDTEVALEAIETWGFERALKQFIGMFALALWDRRDRKLFLVRDRMGEKPLYYGKAGSAFIFGSELKALRAFPDADLEVDRQALSSFLQFGYVPTLLSIYRGVKKLCPGSYMAVSVSMDGTVSVGEPTPYWSLDLARDGARIQDLKDRDDKQLVDELITRLSATVRRQMVADVPLGAFLSGGIDSSTIVSLMQTQSSRPIRTFTIGFHERGYNEAPYAKQVAQHLGTDHTEFYIDAAEAAAVIPRLPTIYDEPFADSSAIPTFLVSQLTKRHVTVSLSGDGGDELFAGYPRYQFCCDLWNRLNKLHPWGRGRASTLLTGLSPRAWDLVFKLVFSNRQLQQINGHRMHRLARVLCAESFDELYVRIISQWHPEDGIVRLFDREREPNCCLDDERNESMLKRMRRFDIVQYLPDDLLTKIDRAAMGVSLESRMPFLDHEIVEFAWALPERVLVRQGESKWILRQLLDRFVPRNLVERPKAGFAIPVSHWLRAELKEWAEHLLDEQTLRTQGYLDPAPIRRMWREHCSGKYDRHTYLWNVLMFQAWLQSQHSMRDQDGNSVSLRSVMKI
jgi:asparagine synthase (glutamine-hydrolysing)